MNHTRHLQQVLFGCFTDSESIFHNFWLIGFYEHLISCPSDNYCVIDGINRLVFLTWSIFVYFYGITCIFMIYLGLMITFRLGLDFCSVNLADKISPETKQSDQSRQTNNSRQSVNMSSLGGVCDSWSEGPGFESCVGWLLRCGHIPVPNWFNKGLVVCITVCGCVHLKDPLESVEKRVSRLRVSVCRRYVHNSDERRR